MDILLSLMAFADQREDLVAFTDPDGAARVLRGKITSEDADAIYLERRDGSWTIYKKTITKVCRRGRR